MRRFLILCLFPLLAGCGGGVGSHIHALKDQSDAAKRGAAAKALGELGPAAREAVPVLLEAMKDHGGYLGPGILYWKPQLYVCDAAAEALAKIGGPEAVAGLSRLLSDANYQVAVRAANTLGKLGTQAKGAIPALLATLDQSNQGSILQAALSALDRIGLEPGTPEAQTALPLLRKSFQQTPRSWHELRLLAIRMTRRLAPEDPVPIPGLIELLGEKMGTAQEQAARELILLGVPVVPHLIPALADRDQAIRAGVATVLGRMPAAVGPLQEALASPKALVRAGSAKALGLLGAPTATAIPALRRLLADSNGSVRVQAARALWVLVLDAKATFPVLAEATQDADATVRADAHQALQQIKPTDDWAVDTLGQFLKAPAKHVRIEAAQALGRIGAPARKAMPLLVAALADPAEEVRLAVAKAVAQVDGK